VAKRHILEDAIEVGGTQDLRLAQRPSPFGTFALQQMAFARAVKHYFAGPGYLETFTDGLPGFNAFGTSHTESLSFESAKQSAPNGFW
jgi:hypothetical protein